MTRPRIGFHASHELYAPSHLLRLARRAEEGGFDAISCSDHFHPWSERHAQCGYAFAWLGAAMQQSTLPFSSVCAPGQRYHPAVVAQAVATLLEMFPDRYAIALGSGEALNESITGDDWPEKPRRNERLRQSVDVMRALWRGEEVTFRGEVVVKEATLYTLPPTPPVVLGAAITADTAAWVGGWADGLITVTAKPEELREKIEAFREHGGEGKPVLLQSVLAFGPTDEQALHAAHRNWRQGALGAQATVDVATPRRFDRATAGVTPGDLRDVYRCTSSWSQVVDWLAAEYDAGFDTIYVHMIGDEIERFIDGFVEHALPQLRRHLA